MSRRSIITLTLCLGSYISTHAQDPVANEPKAPEIKSAANKLVQVTVYQNTAMVTRDVTVPDVMGLTEIIVTSLPPSTMPNTLSAESSDGVRVLSARYRTRAIAQDNRKEIRELQSKIKELTRKQFAIQAELATVGLNQQMLSKLEGFTVATMTQLTEKGQLNSDKTIELTNFIREARLKGSKEEVTLKEQIDSLKEEQSFAARLLQEKAGVVSRTERDAVIVVDKTQPGSKTIRLNYLVRNATWRPQYKFRAGTKDKDPVQLEYMASVLQQTGEDWNGVTISLSTAQPLLSSAPPELRALEISISGATFAGQMGGRGGSMDNPALPLPPGGMPQQAQAVPSRSKYLKDLGEQSRALKKNAIDNFNSTNLDAGNRFANEAAALDQYRDLFSEKEEIAEQVKLSMNTDIATGPSLTFRLKDRHSLPSRNDDQLVEIARLELNPKFTYKAVPVLTTQVYRLADLINSTEYVLLPGEATMYLGSDFVGQSLVPLVAIGKPFTVGFGADPQLQVSRQLIDKSRSIQGGNQVLTFKYRILLSSYKTGATDVQVWDRMPYAEAEQTIGVSLTKTVIPLSTDSLYQRDDRRMNLLRWDVKVEPKQSGEKAMAIEYDYKLECAANVMISAFQTK